MTTERERRQRAARIVKLRRQGKTLEAIGTEVGLKRERVRQILLDESFRRRRLAEYGIHHE